MALAQQQRACPDDNSQHTVSAGQSSEACFKILINISNSRLFQFIYICTYIIVY